MTYAVKEIFLTLQGEGAQAGRRAVFLRFAGCNLWSGREEDRASAICQFCDTDFVGTNGQGGGKFASAEALADAVEQCWGQLHRSNRYIVITGGEPLLGWQRAYQELFDHDHMRGIKNVTFETNGTQKLQPKFKTYLNEWLAGHNELTFSVSPKLSASGEIWDEAIKPEVVAEYQEVGTVYLKFVIDSEVHFEEVDRAVTEYRRAGFEGVVYVMPQGGVVAPYAENRVNVADWALARGYYYTPRLHVDLWGNGWGK